MDGGCTCCCTCSISFNNNPTGRKNRWHTFNASNHTSFLADEAYTIHMCLLDSQFLSTCQQTPRCEPDAILFLELPMFVNSLIGSLCCLEQMLRVTQATGMLFRSDASKKEQKDKARTRSRRQEKKRQQKKQEGSSHKEQEQEARTKPAARGRSKRRGRKRNGGRGRKRQKKKARGQSNQQGATLGSSSKTTPCNIHAAITKRFASSHGKPACIPKSPLPLLTTSLRHHFPKSTLPLVTTSLSHHFP